VFEPETAVDPVPANSYQDAIVVDGLIGHNGAGKSSLLNVVARFFNRPRAW